MRDRNYAGRKKILCRSAVSINLQAQAWRSHSAYTFNNKIITPINSSIILYLHTNCQTPVLEPFLHTSSRYNKLKATKYEQESINYTQYDFIKRDPQNVFILQILAPYFQL